MLFFQKSTKWAISTLNQFIPPPLASLESNCPNHNNLSI
ncbi:hypothetical protein T4A_12549 [Trichinella pseudospiralis]|uniref:Uncharacterized protein n=1 Tax=Trichinella pseudospiralis TaxID=6337 RepID=A0A0V1DMK0_TRIPS|nr:hypothetical protein T4A_12549 [Trichinella pseudospiralis]